MFFFFFYKVVNNQYAEGVFMVLCIWIFGAEWLKPFPIK